MKLSALILLIFLSSQLFSQITLSGKITDDKQNILEMASIVVSYKATNNFVTYTTSNSEGGYKLNLKKHTDYLIKISYVGMQTIEFDFLSGELNKLQNFVLKPDNKLDEVNVTYKMPVSVKGDTIIYDADSFTTGNEKKLKDVLEKLPGVEVEKNGDVKVDGKKVKKVMVEGKDFFEGDTKLATKNIPASAIDKIEVLKNHNDIGMMKTVSDNEEDVAMNIKLKEGKKRFWFGDINTGAGLNGRYRFHPNIFYYNPKYSLNFIGDLNNLGEQSFTWHDYFKFMGGFSQLSSNGGINIDSDLSFLTTQNQKAKSFRNKFAATNLSYTPNDKFSVTVLSVFSRTNTKLQNQLTRNYYNTKTSDSNISENITDNTKQQNQLNISKFSLKYVPNIKNQINYDGMVKFSDFNEYNAINSNINNTISETKKHKPKSTIHNLAYYFNLNEKHLFSWKTQFLQKKEKPFYNASINRFLFADILKLDSMQSGYKINQLKNTTTLKGETKFNYYYVLNSKSNFNFNMGFVDTRQNLKSKIQQISDDKNIFDVKTAKSNNNINYSTSNMFFGGGIRFLMKKFIFYPAITFHYFTIDNSQSDKKLNVKKLLPELSIKYRIQRNQILKLNYNNKIEFPNVNNIAEGYVLRSYNQLFGGNKNLKNSQYHNFLVSYSNFDAFNFSNYHGYIRYTKSIGSIRQQIENKNTFNLTSPMNSNLIDENLGASFNYHKSFIKFKWNLSASVNYSGFYSRLKLDKNKNKAVRNNLLSHTYSCKFISNLKGFFNFDFAYSVNLNHYKNANHKQIYTQHSPFAGIDIVFLKDFYFQSDITFNIYRNKSQLINRYSFWNGNLSYQKKDSKWEFNILCSNILNTQHLNTNNGNELYYSNSMYEIQPRFITFGIIYNL